MKYIIIFFLLINSLAANEFVKLFPLDADDIKSIEEKVQSKAKTAEVIMELHFPKKEVVLEALGHENYRVRSWASKYFKNDEAYKELLNKKLPEASDPEVKFRIEEILKSYDSQGSDGYSYLNHDCIEYLAGVKEDFSGKDEFKQYFFHCIHSYTSVLDNFLECNQLSSEEYKYYLRGYRLVNSYFEDESYAFKQAVGEYFERREIEYYKKHLRKIKIHFSEKNIIPQSLNDDPFDAKAESLTWEEHMEKSEIKLIFEHFEKDFPDDAANFKKMYKSQLVYFDPKEAFEKVLNEEELTPELISVFTDSIKSAPGYSENKDLISYRLILSNNSSLRLIGLHLIDDITDKHYLMNFVEGLIDQSEASDLFVDRLLNIKGGKEYCLGLEPRFDELDRANNIKRNI